MRRAIVVNPLGSALKHYTAAMQSALYSAGYACEAIAIPEASQRSTGRVGWILDYIEQLWRVRNLTEDVIVVWPVLGYWDLVINRLMSRRSKFFVFHDPRPLVRSIGYGRLARTIARRSARKNTIITHSRIAAEHVKIDLPSACVVLLPHPVIVGERQIRDDPDREQPRPHGAIRVLGQYKADRDIDLLAEIGETLAGEHRLEIVGRGWPEVPGWDVTDSFVSENQLDDLLGSSRVVIIPYKRFYQSGIAVRCLEHGTPFIGPIDSSLTDLLGKKSQLLYVQNDWQDALEYALTALALDEIKRTLTRLEAETTVTYRKLLKN